MQSESRISNKPELLDEAPHKGPRYSRPSMASELDPVITIRKAQAELYDYQDGYNYSTVVKRSLQARGLARLDPDKI